MESDFTFTASIPVSNFYTLSNILCYVHTHKGICTVTYMHKHTCSNTHAQTHTHIHTYTHTYIHTHTHQSVNYTKKGFPQLPHITLVCMQSVATVHGLCSDCSSRHQVKLFQQCQHPTVVHVCKVQNYGYVFHLEGIKMSM